MGLRSISPAAATTMGMSTAGSCESGAHVRLRACHMCVRATAGKWGGVVDTYTSRPSFQKFVAVVTFLVHLPAGERRKQQ